MFVMGEEFGWINELDSCTTSSRKLVADMATVRESCQGDGNLVIPDDLTPIKKIDIEHCGVVVASWNQFRWIFRSAIPIVYLRTK